jgi:hypothetical protein
MAQLNIVIIILIEEAVTTLTIVTSPLDMSGVSHHSNKFTGQNIIYLKNCIICNIIICE